MAAIVILAASTVTAFATLGDGKSSKTKNPNNYLLSSRTSITPGLFSLKSGYNFRGNHPIAPEKDRYINLNTVITYQKGNTTYIVPLKKKVLLNKITFNPNEATRN